MLSFFRRRDSALYPDDEIGNELWRFARTVGDLPNGVTLWVELAFRAERDAREMAGWLEGQGFDVIVGLDSRNEDVRASGTWNVDADKRLRASHADLKAAVGEIRTRTRFRNGEVTSWLLMAIEQEPQA
jgi:hypothetical protein